MPEPLDLDAIEARANDATSGPWTMNGTDLETNRRALGEMYCFSPYHRAQADGSFIAHAREDVPALVAEVRRLRELLDERTAAVVDKALENADLRRQLDVVRSAATNTN